jgi:hypothetical protein
MMTISFSTLMICLYSQDVCLLFGIDKFYGCHLICVFKRMAEGADSSTWKISK